MIKVVAIVGPTASGKSALGISLAKELGGEIISADSRQVYRDLDIGTGKVTEEEMDGVPHHLLDITEPREIFTASAFVREGRAAIESIVARGKLPIIVGGTGFYIDALLGIVGLADVPPDSEFRKSLKKLSLKELYDELKKIDPKKADSIDAKNRVRLVRALEIARSLGSVPSTLPKQLYDALWIGISTPKYELEQNIHTRLHARMKAGMLEEVKKLHREGLSYMRMEELGLEYRYIVKYLKGEISEAETLNSLEKDIRKYAKRQITWFKRNSDVKWFSLEEYPRMLALVQEFRRSDTRRVIN